MSYQGGQGSFYGGQQPPYRPENEREYMQAQQGYYPQYPEYSNMVPPQYANQPPQMYSPFAYSTPNSGGGGQAPPGSRIPFQDEILANPMMANMAMHYGNKLMEGGREMVDKELTKYVPIPLLRHYFLVDTGYVVKKLRLVAFPFTHTDWSRKLRESGPAAPREDVNSPDLYIPLMAYVTYLLVAGLALGANDRFSPDLLALFATQAIAWTIFEIIIQLATIYIFNIDTSLNTFELLAFSGYKFIGIIASVLLSLPFMRKGYYLGLIYFSAALIFFLVRALKVQVISNFNSGAGYAPPAEIYSSKRKMYLLLFIGMSQPFLMWWLSHSLMDTAQE